jgi:hypothetical protein
LQETAAAAEAAGAVSSGEANRWLADLEREDRRGSFFAAVTGFCVGGTKP